jgi:uncharacterized protein (DUF1499 family)
MTFATTTVSRRPRSMLRWLPPLALALAVIAVALIGIGPLGWRLGLWHFRFGLLTLMPWAAYFGIAAAIVAVLSLFAGRARIAWSGIAIAVIALAIGAAMIYVPWHYDRLRQTVPPIHDITTDTDDPPAFVAVLQLRTQGDNPAAYEGSKVAEQQKRAYPDIAPLNLAMPPEAAFKQALATAEHMGWTIDGADPAAGRIEASQRSIWYGFTDDVVIRVAAAGTGSRVDMRSAARLGRSDFGVNAARVRGYLAALGSAAGS